MKIAMLGQKKIPSREGGVEIVVEELSTRMVKLGHSVTCYNRKSNKKNVETKNEYKGINIKQVFTVDKKGFAAMTSSFFACLRAGFSDCDVVHIHAEGPAFFSFIPKFLGKRVIVTVHGLDWNRAKWGRFASRYIKAGEKNAVRFSDKIIVLSENTKKYFKDTYNKETCFIQNGVNKPEKVKIEELNKFGLTKDGYILYLGRIVPEKGIHYLIEAFKQTKTDKKLVIAGGSSDSDEYFKKTVDISKDDSRIIFTGFVTGQILEELYSNAYIYCLPSDLEGMPLSLLEAMSYGNCCLVSDIPECAEVVEDKALLFENGNIQSLKEKLCFLLQNESTVNEYKNNASNFICNKYNWDEVVKKTLEIY